MRVIPVMVTAGAFRGLYPPAQETLYRLDRRPCHSTVESKPMHLQGPLHGSSHPAGKYHFDPLVLQKSGDAGVVMLHPLDLENGRSLDLAVGRVRNHEGLRAAEVGIDVSLQIRHCDDHPVSFVAYIFSGSVFLTRAQQTLAY